MPDSDDEHGEERRRSREAALKGLEDFDAEIEESKRIDERSRDRENTRRLDAEISAAHAIHGRQQGHSDTAGLQREAAVASRAASRADDSAAAKDLEELAEQTEELILTIEESMKLRAEAMAFRAELSPTNGLSPNFKAMTFGQQMAEKNRLILEYNDRVRKDPPIIDGFVFDGVINTADYAVHLANKTHFAYAPTADPDDFETKMLQLYHGSFMHPGEDMAYRITRRINGGPFFRYISLCAEHRELKEFMLELYDFWKEKSKCTYIFLSVNAWSCLPHTSVILIIDHFIYLFTHSAKPYRDELVTKGAVSTESPNSPDSIEHHKYVKEFCERVSKAKAREYFSAVPRKLGALSCIYEMHRLGDDDDDVAAILRKIGKIFSTASTLGAYWYDSTSGRRNPFKGNDEDEVDADEVDGNILIFIAREGLFDKSKFDDLSNYLVEFIEVFTTAALYPTITICPAITHLVDAGYVKDDPRFFATVKKVVHLIHDGKFELVEKKQVRDELCKYSDEEWDELIVLRAWYYNNCKNPLECGELSPNRAEYLQQIGFFRIVSRNQSQASTRSTKWMDTFNNVRNHAMQYGFKDWEETEGGETLYKWCRKQRNQLKSGGVRVKTAKLQEKNQWRIDVLNSIGFPWTGEWR